jgi:hypothetical protein
VKLIIAGAVLLAAASAPAARSQAAVSSKDAETLTGADLDDGGLWRPVNYYGPQIDEFYADTKRLQKANAALRREIAAKYGLTLPALNATVALLRKMNSYDGRHGKSELRTNALHLVDVSNRAPIALMLAAAAIDQLAENCSADDIALLMKGSRNPDSDLWSIAASCPSSNVFATAIDRSPASRPALLYIGMNWTNGDPATELAATDMLLRPEFLAQVDPRDRERIEADIAAFKLAKLLNLGLLRQALAFGDSLNPEIRTRALKPTRDDIRTTIGGIELKTSPFWDSPAVNYAAALALSGRNAEARSVLGLIAPADKRNKARACLDAGKADCPVGDLAQDRIPVGALVVDQFLDHPNADPYVLLESEAIGHSLSGAAVTEALCRLLSQPSERPECDAARQLVANDRVPDDNETDGDRALWAAIEHVGGEPFERAKATYAAALVTFGSVKQESRNWTRATVDPAPVAFRELPIPKSALAKQAPPTLSPKGLSPLPEGYTLVRAERAGDRVVAISLSQKFDPNGEVTAGGYWVHLSDDGGKTWQSPLYTGLAEHFPYVVAETSRLPMISGDHIRLAVEESLIDTASISYPPVGTKVRQRRTGIYLDIPIAELRKDTNADGITDIAAHHLLLDGERRVNSPFIVGSDRNCAKPLNGETLARVEIVKKLFRVEAQALIEPVGAKAFHFGDWRKTGATSKPPIFLKGNPDDYRCLSIDRLMVVYGDADQGRLRKFSPDFQLIELPPIRWNRDHTRGFVKWSMGFAGGTYRLTREGTGWKLESIGEWIT